MNSAIASNINGGGVSNQQIASGSNSSFLLSSIDFSLSETRTNFSGQGKFIIQLESKELCNGENKAKLCDLNKNLIDNAYLSVNGNKDKDSEDSMPVPKVQLYTGKIHVEWHQIYEIGAGLQNLGNSCFMNTVIQCLTYCPPLANYLLHDNDHASKCKIAGFCMMCVLQKHMKRTIGKVNQVINPSDIYHRLKLIAKHFQFGRQEDAHEFLRYIIDNLWKSCLPQTNGVTKLDPASKETTVINKIFGGYHRSQVICMRCKKQSNTFDHFMDFILDIKQNVSSLEKALEKFTQPELLQQENCYKCPKCKMKVEAQKRFSVYRAPTVATFQLKRFDYNRSFGGKITKPVSYPERLNLRPYMSETQGSPVWYRLNAVLVHSGGSCNSGHYYCYVKNSNDEWYIMDDSRVQKVSLNTVLTQCAYVLFYIKMESSDRPLFKKCLDNKSSYLKGTVSNSHFSKVPEMGSLKPIPLVEKVSPFANSKPFNSPNSVRKLNYPSPKREKVSFGFRSNPLSVSVSPHKNRSTLPEVVHPKNRNTSSEVVHPKNRNTSSEVVHPKNRNTSSEVVHPKNRNTSSEVGSASRVGLVPYGGDSSESDASESNPSQSKSNSGSKSEGKQHNNKNVTLESSRSSFHTEMKPSKLVSNSPSISSVAPKVSATSPWIVTDVPQTPSCPSSNSSGVNSTTNWHVIEAASPKLNDSPKGTNNKDYSKRESADSPNLSMPIFPTSTKDTNDQDTLSDRLSHCTTNKLPRFENNSSPQKCNFRKQIYKNKAFPEDGETVNSTKRKSCDLYSDLSTGSFFEHDEARLGTIPKKAKYAENSPSIGYENGMRNCGSNVEIANNGNGASFAVQRHYSASNCDSYPRTSLLNGVSGHDDTPTVLHNQSSNILNGTLEHSKDIPEKDSMFSKGKHKDRFFSESSKSFPYEKGNVLDSNEGKNTSLYGTEVPTWREGNHYRPSINTGHENRRSFDGYDQEFDRGKVRKSKVKDRYHNFHRKNPFQKHAERYHGKYNNNKFYSNSYQNHRKYDSHHNWKSNSSNNYQKYRNHHRHF